MSTNIKFIEKIQDQDINLDHDLNDQGSFKNDPFGQRMKYYEDICPKNVPATEPFIARLDGHCFSKFTKGLKKPFDNNFVLAMVLTMNDLIKTYNARTGYCHSDEITLIFDRALKPEDTIRDKVHIFNGRTTKINTLLAGYCSARFNYHFISLVNQDKDSYNEHVIEKINNMSAHFDSRILVFYDEENEETKSKDWEIINHMIWRSCRDCIRNCISTYGRHICGHRQIH